MKEPHRQVLFEGETRAVIELATLHPFVPVR